MSGLHSQERRAELKRGLTDNEAKLYAWLERNHFVTSKQIAHAMAAQPEAVERVLSKLRGLGVIESQKSGVHTLWRPAPVPFEEKPKDKDGA